SRRGKTPARRRRTDGSPRDRYWASTETARRSAPTARRKARPLSCPPPLLDPCEDRVAQQPAGQGRVIGRRIGPALDMPGKRPGDARLAHHGVKTAEFGIAPPAIVGEFDYMHRLAGGRRLA